jgi:hypothetical protein
MRLASDLGRKGIATREVYPGKLAERARLNALGYKTKMVPPAHLAAAVQELFPFPVHWAAVDNWHTFDALLAYISGWRYTQGKHEAFGDPREGQIII